MPQYLIYFNQQWVGPTMRRGSRVASNRPRPSCETSRTEASRSTTADRPRSLRRRQSRTSRVELVFTDGPFAESKESLAGYWIVDVADEARALAIAEHVVAFTEGPLEVRAVADGPPPDLGRCSP